MPRKPLVDGEEAPPPPQEQPAAPVMMSLSQENFASLLSTIQQAQVDMCERVFERLSQLPLSAPSPPAQRPLTPLGPSAGEAPPVPTGTFATCTARFTGHGDIEAFIDAIVSFKEAANVPDERAIKGLSMLLVDEAATWWQSARAEITSWTEALTYLRDAYGDRRSEARIYRELFSTEQREDENTDLFIARSRSLLTKLPPKDLSVKVQLDMIFSRMHSKITKHIRRDEFHTFKELLNKAHNVEDNIRDARSRRVAVESQNKAAANYAQPASTRSAGNARARAFTSTGAPRALHAHAGAPPPQPERSAGTARAAPPATAPPPPRHAPAPPPPSSAIVPPISEYHDGAPTRQRPYCVYCKRYGHLRDQCRKLAEQRGRDHRLGFGFRFGNHADLQVMYEFGPQTRTRPLQPVKIRSASYRERVTRRRPLLSLLLRAGLLREAETQTEVTYDVDLDQPR